MKIFDFELWVIRFIIVTAFSAIIFIAVQSYRYDFGRSIFEASVAKDSGIEPIRPKAQLYNSQVLVVSNQMTELGMGSGASNLLLIDVGSAPNASDGDQIAYGMVKATLNLSNVAFHLRTP